MFAKDISVIITLTKQQKYSQIDELFLMYRNALLKTGKSFEIIYVTDVLSVEIIHELEKLAVLYDEIKIVKLAKWFGNASALMAGYEESIGRNILTLAPILQVDVNEIINIVNSFEDCDMMIAKRKRKLDKAIHRVQSSIFHTLLNAIVGSDFHDLGCHLRLFKREILGTVNIYGDQYRYLPIIAQRYGYKVKEMEAHQYKSDVLHNVYSPREYSHRIFDIISIFFLVKFTKKPLRFFGLPGLVLTVIGVILGIYLFYERSVLGVPLADRPMLLASIMLVVFGFQFLAIGLVAEILIFTHAAETKDYIVDKIVDRTKQKEKAYKVFNNIH